MSAAAIVSASMTTAGTSVAANASADAGAERLVVYSANLPPTATACSLGSAAFDDSGQPANLVGRDFGGSFWSASVPGGQVSVPVSCGSALLRLRWICLAHDPAIGTVWRLYAARDGGECGWLSILTGFILDHGNRRPEELFLPMAPRPIPLQDCGFSDLRFCVGAAGLTARPSALNSVMVVELRVVSNGRAVRLA